MAFDAQTPSTLFVAFADPPPDRDAEFNEWYDTIHGPDALANGSFTAMHRFRAVGEGHRAAPYLALWEGRFTSESEAWAYIGPRAQALREAGRAGDISSVRFALMLFRAANPRGSRCEPVRAITTVQNDWRDVAGAPGAQAWWDATGLDAIDAPTRWLVTSDAAGRGAGYHLAIFARRPRRGRGRRHVGRGRHRGGGDVAAAALRDDLREHCRRRCRRPTRPRARACLAHAVGADHEPARMTGAVTYDFFSEATRDDPFALFHQLREHDPVYETDFGYWYVSRYDDVVRLLRDTRLTSGRGVPDSLGVTDGPMREIMDNWMMALDGPEHRRARDLISRAFTPRAVDELRPAIEAAAVPLVDRLVAEGGGDLVECLAFPLPMEVTRLLFGVDPADWDAGIVAVFDPRRRSGRGWVDDMQRLTDSLRGVVADHRAGTAPPTGLFAALGTTDDDGLVLSEFEQLANAVLLVTAGFETTMGLLTNAVRTLLLHPGELALLLDDPSLAASAVDEVLRFEPPALFTTRYATEAIEVAGSVIPAGANVMFSSVAANRDPARYHDPDRFDITRRDIRPVTFGGGVHSCIGSTLARVEAEIALTTLFAAAPTLSLVPPLSPFQGDNPSVRMPEHLRVRTGAPEGDTS